MASMKSRELGAGWRSSWGATLSSVALGLWVGGCGGAGAEVTPTEAESEERSSHGAGGEGISSAHENHPEGTTTAVTNPFAVPEDASDALRQAEWLREQQSRAYRVLEMQIERGLSSCEEAEADRAEVCSLSDRVCEQADIDRAAAPRCDDAMQRCGAARPLAQQACSD